MLQDGPPLAYASRPMDEAEQRYTPTELFMLWSTYGTYGKILHVEYDHKLSGPILKKPLFKAAPSLQGIHASLSKDVPGVPKNALRLI